MNPQFVRANEVSVLVGSAAKLRRMVPNVMPLAFGDTIEWMVRRGADAAGNDEAAQTSRQG